MLAKRIIPCLDVKDGRVVKGISFVNLRDAGDPVEMGAFYDREGADELVFLDITASHERRRTVVELASRVAEEVFIPYTVGGGISTVAEMREILSAGADKVSVNTAAIERPELITEAADRFGSQCVVVAIDAKRKDEWANGRMGDGANSAIRNPQSALEWEVYVHGGRTPTGLDAVEWVKRAEALGAGEILLTSMDCDGTKAGFDNELTRAVSEAVSIPVIASGGGGIPAHFEEVLSKGKADAALAASIFHYGEIKISELKSYLTAAEIPIRPVKAF